MATIRGIDEAGYGPLLGPLVVTGVGVDVPDEHAETCLWTLLRASVSRRHSRRDPRLPVLDSKKLYSRGEGLAALERTALTTLRLWGRQPASFRDLLTAVRRHGLDDLGEYPWYREFDVDLPVAADADSLRMLAHAVQRDWANQGVRLADIACEILPEGHFNRMVDATRNKGTVLLGLVLRIVHGWLSAPRGQGQRICVDHQGGREHYGPALLTSFAGRELTILEESPARSAYELGGPAGQDRIEFVTSGEDRHLPIALASILSKYVRELFMIGLNRFWQRQVRGLRPTAGYYTDGRRFLADIGPFLRRTGLDQRLLVRTR